MPVVYALPKKLHDHARKLLSPEVEVIDQDGLPFKLAYFTSRYIFSAHWKFPRFYTRKQIVVNLWHGVGHKKIGLMRGSSGIPADFTVATSELTKKAFAQSFGVPEESVLISGYPRNDIMLRASNDRAVLKSRLNGNLSAYRKILMWLPTFRTDTANNLTNGRPVDNPFQIEGFNTAEFNDYLVEQNVLCIVKPHPLDFQRVGENVFSNVLVINDDWILAQGITLYHLVACTDIMVSDVSSIICDYLLLDQPVICFSTDFDEYRANRGFYFEDIEAWLPSKLIRTQPEFMQYLRNILTTGIDPWAQKRKELKDAFFKYHDAGSTERLLRQIFS
jgi:CDP-glycerol glycerophosphotransferase (TagB/SpsB family)